MLVCSGRCWKLGLRLLGHCFFALQPRSSQAEAVSERSEAGQRRAAPVGLPLSEQKHLGKGPGSLHRASAQLLHPVAQQHPGGLGQGSG